MFTKCHKAIEISWGILEARRKKDGGKESRRFFRFNRKCGARKYFRVKREK